MASEVPRRPRASVFPSPLATRLSPGISWNLLECRSLCEIAVSCARLCISNVAVQCPRPYGGTLALCWKGYRVGPVSLTRFTAVSLWVVAPARSCPTSGGECRLASRISLEGRTVSPLPQSFHDLTLPLASWDFTPAFPGGRRSFSFTQLSLGRDFPGIIFWMTCLFSGLSGGVRGHP